MSPSIRTPATRDQRTERTHRPGPISIGRRIASPLRDPRIAAGFVCGCQVAGGLVDRREDHRGHGSGLVVADITAQDAQVGGALIGAGIDGFDRVFHFGLLRAGCSRASSAAGSRACLRRARSALATATRVAAGSMMPSSSPRSAARNGRRDVVGVLVREPRAHGGDVFAGLLGALDLAAVQDVDGALAAHHRDLGGRPGEVDVGAELLASPSRCRRRRRPCGGSP